MDEKQLWERCVAFHGHVCGGLTIGFKAALYAMELLKVRRAEDELLVCIAENDACGVDAIQVVLGCTVGKGNLLFHLTGKQAFSIYDRATGRSVRLVLKDLPDAPDRSQMATYLAEKPPADLFDVKTPKLTLPARAKIFASYPCANCGEATAENHLHLENNKKLCPDCHQKYDRFNI